MKKGGGEKNLILQKNQITRDLMEEGKLANVPGAEVLELQQKFFRTSRRRRWEVD